jgi:hypothetical protein
MNPPRDDFITAPSSDARAITPQADFCRDFRQATDFLGARKGGNAPI